MRVYVRCNKCSKVIGDIDETRYMQFGIPIEYCDECKKKICPICHKFNCRCIDRWKIYVHSEE